MYRPPFATLVVLIAALVALWWGFADRNREARGPFVGDEAGSVGSLDSDGGEEAVSDERGELSDEEASVDEATGVPVGANRLALISAVEQDAARFLPENAGIARFWFTSDREAYVEYRRSGIARADRMAFIVASGGAGGLASERAALYGLNESGGWELLEGEEVLYVNPQKDLYEKDASGQWMKVN